ncbi:mannosyl-3-phosphoglycerate phosphatase [Mangrovibacter phragmitis]|uniref:Mannosyl-3-phosphoglycerate phosphatase n=1 Tax=Mangrovibacter phragmitis TaxID=1691903 RepID=A0A1B7L8T9_9ENTR|nr:mannosyl-3-phosphoglycerate phosphatase-related protein [Mangrovibacter phragmitis]OAT78651.1 mannosyl-3-phosphoglycerate phosphatase [Mangrovibacter phragmitis]
MPHLHQPLLIFSDLDGTLLDHHTYDWQPAASWLARLKQHDVPVILCSSKTPAEITRWQKILGLTGYPFIAENGAAIQYPGPDSKPEPLTHNGITRANIGEQLHSLRRNFRFTGFLDVGVDQICSWTGLSPEQATLAMQRTASEPLIWEDTPERLGQFREALRCVGLGLTQGGRFWHVADLDAGKGRGAQAIITFYQQHDGIHRLTLGLGDAPNDVSLLNQMDYAVIINSHGAGTLCPEQEQRQPDRILRTTHYGPEGWREGLDHFISVSD